MMEEEEKHGPPVFNVEGRDPENWDDDPVSANSLLSLLSVRVRVEVLGGDGENEGFG